MSIEDKDSGLRMEVRMQHFPEARLPLAQPPKNTSHANRFQWLENTVSTLFVETQINSMTI